MYCQKNLSLSHRNIKEPMNNYNELEPSINELYEELEPYLPLLHKLNKQNKWQLWLINAPYISRFFVESLGLTASKIILLPYILKSHYPKVITQALLNGNFSYILSNKISQVELISSQGFEQSIPIFQLYCEKTHYAETYLNLVRN